MELFRLGIDDTDYCLRLQEMMSPFSSLGKRNYRAANTLGAQVSEASLSAEK